MLDLEAGVDLEEGDGAVLADQELAGAGADVAGLAQDRLGGLVEAGHLLLGEERRGRLLDELLVAALQRAVAGGDHHDVAVLVGQALGLDVARLVEVLLDEALAATERRHGLAHRGLEELGDLAHLAGDLEAAAAAAERRLDRDRQAVLLGEGDRLVGVLERVLGAGRQRGADLLGDVAGLDLVAEALDRLGRRADPDQPGVDHGLGEVGVLGEEAVARVHRVGAGLLRDRDDLGDVEVGLAPGSSRPARGPRRPAGRTARPGPGRRTPRRWRCRRPCRPGSPGRRSRRGWRSGPSATGRSLAPAQAIVRCGTRSVGIVSLGRL